MCHHRVAPSDKRWLPIGITSLSLCGALLCAAEPDMPTMLAPKPRINPAIQKSVGIQQVQAVAPKPNLLERMPPVPNPDGEPDTRLSTLGSSIGATPKPTKEVQQRFNQFISKVVDPENTLDLVLKRTRLMVFKEGPTRIQIADETIASTTVITPEELSITGKKVGTTVMTLWFGDPKIKGKQNILSYLIRVIPDPELKERTDRVYDALAKEINQAFPDSVVKIKHVGDKIVLSGEVKDIQEGYQILRIVRANASRGTPPASIPVGQLNITVPADALTDADGTGEQSLQNFLVAGGPDVINQLRVAGEQQVMLRVSVSEVNRSAARSVGINFSVSNASGLAFAQLTGNLLTNSSGTVGFNSTSGSSSGINLPARFDGGKVLLAINALKTLNLARSLAEPNLVTLNGRAASFRAGGQFPVPVVTGATAIGLQGVQFVPFGVQLQFTPIITDHDRVRLTINANVSTRDDSTSATINGTNVPSMTERTFNTTVELREGQTLAVAGLIQHNLGTDSTRVPFWGDIPLFGRLFASDRTSCADQELVILITPEVVHPLEKKELQPLPGHDWMSPTDVEFYLGNRLLSHRGQSSTIQPVTNASRPNLLPHPVLAKDNADPKRLQAIEQKLLIGTGGYSQPR